MAEGKGALWGELVAGDGANASMLSLANPEGADVIVTRFMIVKSTGTGAANTVDAGIAAAANGASDTLLDGQSLQAAGLLDNIQNQANNGLRAALWPADRFITATPSVDISATPFAATYYVEYVRV